MFNSFIQEYVLIFNSRRNKFTDSHCILKQIIFDLYLACKYFVALLKDDLHYLHFTELCKYNKSKYLWIIIG